MRVAFDARYLTGRPSGIGTYSENLLRELLALDSALEFLLVSRRPGLAAAINVELGGERCDELVYDVEPRSFRTLYQLPRRLRTHLFDLFHGPFNILPSGLDRPGVVTIHDVMQLQNPANIATSRFVQQTAGRFWRVRIAHAVRRSTRICAVSEATRDAILERFPGVAEERVRVTPNGTDPFFGEPASDDERELARRVIGTDAPFVLCVGNESPHKNHHRAVEAFVRAFDSGSSMRLVLVRRSVRRDPRMVELLRRPEVAARTIVVDGVDRSTLRALYQLARVFFFPSWVEGFGLPILEAMASGCPVVTSDRSAPAEVAGDAALLTNPFSVQGMADALAKLEADEALRARLTERGLGRVAHYTWARCARETLTAYRQASANG